MHLLVDSRKEQPEIYNLPEMWINVTLGDILILEYGKSLPKNSRQDGKYPIFGSNGIIGYHNNFLVEGPVIIVGRKGSVGSVHFSNENCWPIDTTYFVKPTDSLNFKFIFFLLESLNLFQLDKSTTIPGLNRDNIYEQVIGLPPLNEQNRIVLKLEEVLSSLDKSKEQLENSLNQLNFYKQSILKQAFEGKLTEEWRKNKNDLKTPQQIINEINVCQDEQYKKELIDFNTGKTKLKPRKPKKITISSEAKALAKIKLPNEWLYIQLKDACHAVERVSSKERKNEDTFIYLDIGSINNNKNIIETYKEYQWKDAPSRAQYIIKLDDILFSTVRTYLKNIAMIEEEKFNHQIASSGFTVIRVLDNFIKPKYIFKYIVSDSFVQPLNELQSGSSYPAVRNSDVFDQFIPICSIEEQNVISEELDRQFSIINHFENTIEKHLLTIESLKQSVLRKAFEGKLSEQDSNDEPASILLERIKAEKEQYLVREKEKKNNSIKIIIMPEELKSILEILNENAEPISSKQLWLSSDKKDDIEEFYAELKKYIESGEIIELPRNGKESFLKLADKS
ncbi:MAG: restriction endonuclease subunit S [Bacteroidaceae bacterium]|nr:restriction endonuclease subunit S [Bacteroidaceae bacterium]